MTTTTRTAASVAIAAALALAASCTARDMSERDGLAARVAQYTVVTLAADTTTLSPRERQMLPILIAAAREMDPIFRDQSYAAYDSLMAATTDSVARRYIAINYGPWDRLASDSPFVAGVGPKPPGANFYPADMTREEFEQAVAASPRAYADSLKHLYTLVRRNASGRLEAIPYHVAYRERHEAAAAKLREAAALAADRGLTRCATTTIARATSRGWT
jgi:hypothetical protein